MDLLVSLSGFTPETTLVAFELVQPRELLVISSENAEQRYAIIDEKLRGRLPPWKIRLHRCNPADPSDNPAPRRSRRSSTSPAARR